MSATIDEVVPAFAADRRQNGTRHADMADVVIEATDLERIYGEGDSAVHDSSRGAVRDGPTRLAIEPRSGLTSPPTSANTP